MHLSNALVAELTAGTASHVVLRSLHGVLCTVSSVLLSRLQAKLVLAFSPAQLAVQKAHAYSHTHVKHAWTRQAHACMQ